MKTLADYRPIVGNDVIDQLEQMAKHLKGIRVVHVNSTKSGGGVAEILATMVPLMNSLGIDTTWEVIHGTPDFYQCTKSFHNAMQGTHIDIPQSLLHEFENVNAANAEELSGTLRESELVFIHDPQPVPLIKYFPNRKGKWIWRCHIDASTPYRPVWRYLRNFVKDYDASIFSLANFAQPLSHPMYLIPPSIDPLSDKNVELSSDERSAVYDRFSIDPQGPLLVQVSRFDRFKDPLGVIEAYKLAKTFTPGLQLVLAGGDATDDPEGAIVLEEVNRAAMDDENIHVLRLPSDAHRTINALQRAAHVVLQKSVREGFGLTVTEAMWKGRPVIGGNTGGIKLQVVNYHTGFLVNTPEGAAHRIRYLLRHPEERMLMGEKAREFVRENFLVTRHLREYLTLILSLLHGNDKRIELD